MCWEKELHKKITCCEPTLPSAAELGWLPQCSVELLQPFHQLAPSTAIPQLLLGTRGLLLYQGRGRLSKTGSQECLRAEMVSHKVILNLWASRTFI